MRDRTCVLGILRVLRARVLSVLGVLSILRPRHPMLKIYHPMMKGVMKDVSVDRFDAHPTLNAACARQFSRLVPHYSMHGAV